MTVVSTGRIATLLSVTPQTPSIHTLRFDVPLKFIPGQSVQVTFPGDTKKRYYSISSSPTEGPFVEITVKSEPGSPVGTALSSLKKGDSLEFDGPLGGSLSLPDPVSGPIAFVAAGTGVTPFRSMIRYLIDDSVPADFWLFHSVRAQADLLFRNDFSSWSKSHKAFHYVPTLTGTAEKDWANETGRINDALIHKHVAGSSCTFLLCGPSTFVHEMDLALRQKLKIPASHIRREKW